ncbi:MAG: hypothetical protein ACI4JM_00290 [Oscillospiraceae bacterium]
MNGTFKKYFAVWAVMFAVFQIICFITPSEINGLNKFGGAFWSGYIFITLAFIGNILCTYNAFKTENTKKFFYNIPLISISYTGIVTMLIFGSAFMIIPSFPNWLGGVICLLILVGNILAVIKASAAGDIVSGIDDKIKANTLFIKSLTIDADGLIAMAKSENVKSECKKIYERVRYSDPASNEALAGIESQITIKFAELKKAVSNDEFENVKSIVNETEILINERNNKCKILK